MVNEKGEATPTVSKTENMDIPAAEAQQSQIAAASTTLKLQQFWPQSAATWFGVAEMQFTLQGITSDKQKCVHTLSALSPSTCEVISDYIANPPDQNRYTTLKQLLLDRLSPSSESQLETLLSGQPLGDRRPSEALRHIRTLAGTNFTDTMIRSIWIRKMPQLIKIALVAQPDTATLDALANMADKMYEHLHPDKQQQQMLSAIDHPSFRPALNTDPQRGRGRGTPTTSGNTLESRLAAIESRLDGFFRSRSRSRTRQSSRQTRSSPHRNTNATHQGKCWYHFRFGINARKCIQPCTFKSPPKVSVAPGSEMDVDSKNYSTSG